ncbi:alternative ribosome rescue aminoacyl-tRNA hydrolase ArfB [Psychroflexus aestuariivivens]|uniref:alternative ribosome rescue aminoacyl-tRNA hydrolase ArfB n=1 Tax=Psychroflexus aestuariivivens TaxID=1795040 RepID=UPI000FD9514B|nr:alternative ribosome rescue aminoacyl-tRNA hydrolase ArfB [Psychroflexus aestuariivivens]
MFDQDEILKEVEFKTALSGGPGGQHVNKTETKVILTWDLEKSNVFSESQKSQLQKKLKTKLNKDQQIQLSVSQTRSQLQNKKLVIQKFLDMLTSALKQKKKRIKTKPSKAAKLKRLKKKKQHSEKKINRKKPKI